MRIVVSHEIGAAGVEYARKNNAELYIANSAEPKEYLDELKRADAFIVRIGYCSREILDACPNLKVIGRTGVGYDSIDVKYATEKGVPVVFTPGANSQSVAEHAVALMFACAKNICEEDTQLRKGNWGIRDAHKAVELAGKKVGIVGVGIIGATVARICRSIGMETAGFNPHHPERVEEAGCQRYNSVAELIRDCDILSLHCPLTEDSRNLISTKELRTMKPTAILINTSRGAIVNSHDLAEALNTGVIAAAGVDVFDEEPARHDDPVFTAKNLISTPHAAALTREANDRMQIQCIEGCIAVCNGEIWPKVVDKSVYEHPKFT
ncbi:MAG: hydroxyacid dehydrogenase [Lawsonibacter sp.]|jgi:D-3-phosphoglycerate dehydrogenase|nr:hydroxyacid dehydrogenase [Lawsonibacter sp.]